MAPWPSKYALCSFRGSRSLSAHRLRDPQAILANRQSYRLALSFQSAALFVVVQASPLAQQAPSPQATPGTASSAVAEAPVAKAEAKAAEDDDDISDISDDDAAAAAAGGAESEVDEDWGEDWE